MFLQTHPIKRCTSHCQTQYALLRIEDAMQTPNVHFEKTREALNLWMQDPSLEPPVSHTFECHIFCEPLDPCEETKQRFVEACEKAGLRALCLGLDYEGKGVVNVLQSTKYYTCDDVHTPVSHMLQDAQKLAETFKVVRLKLEAVAADPGVPQTKEEAAQIPGDTYFEYHLKIKAPVTPENDKILKVLARELTKELGVKVPFSCNNMGAKTQRFLNARTYGLGYQESFALVERIVDAVCARGFEVSKVIREFVVFDTNKELDRGWLEFS